MGRLRQGTLRGYDQTTNMILHNAQERVFSLNEGVEVVQLGLYIIRGDNMCGILRCKPCFKGTMFKPHIFLNK